MASRPAELVTAVRVKATRLEPTSSGERNTAGGASGSATLCSTTGKATSRTTATATAAMVTAEAKPASSAWVSP